MPRQYKSRDNNRSLRKMAKGYPDRISVSESWGQKAGFSQQRMLLYCKEAGVSGPMSSSGIVKLVQRKHPELPSWLIRKYIRYPHFVLKGGGWKFVYTIRLNIEGFDNGNQ